MHSIPVVIALLEKHQNDLSITERPNFLRVLNDIGLERNKLEGFQDQKVTQMVVAHFRASLPDISKKNGCALSLSLDAVKSIRDKRIAHDENVTVAKLPPVTWDELNGLLAYAKNFIGAIGWGYLSTAYENGSGGYMLSSDALRTSTAMRRLLKQAGIEENETKDA
jgi:hypothetical protein